MHLTICLNGAGYHPAAWRLSAGADELDASRIRSLTTLAEAGDFAAAFFGLSFFDETVQSTGRIAMVRPDALTRVATLIAQTERIGLGATYGLERSEPYTIARSLATLDLLSLGRTAWLVELAAPGARSADGDGYLRETECIDVVRKLWDSWEDGAFTVDKPKGQVADSSKVHRIDHAGAYFSVRGPLNVPRPTQGQPVLVIADPGTVAGRKLAAGVADVVLVNCSTAEAARGIRQTMRSFAAAAQRDPDTLRVLVNIFPVLGSTETEARRAESELRHAVDPALAFALVQSRLGTPSAAPGGAALDRAVLSDLWPPACIAAGGLSPGTPVVAAGREIAGQMAGLPFVGTPEALADRLAELYATQCCDGFNIVPAILPDGLRLLVERTVPLLRTKKLVPGQLPGRTLRGRLGLAHPRSRYASDRQTG